MNYNLFRRDRDSHGGGILVAAKKHLSVAVGQRLPDTELLVLDLLKFNIRLLTGYLPDKYNQAQVLAMCDGIRNTYRFDSSNLLVGDFNMSFVDWKASTATHQNGYLFLDCVAELGFTQLVDQPTRGRNILDLVLTDSDRLIYEVAVAGNLGLSDHHSVTFLINNRKPVGDQPVESEVDFPRLRNYLGATGWAGELLGRSDVGAMGDQLYRILHAGISACSKPVWTSNAKCRKSNDKLPSTLRTLRHKKLRAWRVYKANRTNTNRFNYYSRQKIYSDAVRQFEIEQEQAVIKANDLTALYKFIKKRTGYSRSIPPLKLNQGLVDETSLKANAFSERFAQNFISDDNYTPACSINPSLDSFTAVVVTADLVLDCIKGLKPSKALGPDGISAFLLKEVMHQICVPLSWLLNLSITTGCLHPLWKSAKICPTFKKGETSDLGNYRPIAITCVICRVLERILRLQMLEFISMRGLISDDQYGFLPGRSTCTQLLTSLDRWTESVDAGIPMDILFIDFAKAFESVSHVKLLAKLDIFGFRGVTWSWFADFLLGRTQYVEIEGVRSEPVPVLSGVPQGSVLGPLLFVIYLNDLVSGSPEVALCKFADDVEMDSQVIDSATSYKLQKSMLGIQRWASDWQLPIAPSKSIILHAGSANFEFDYSVNDTPIPSSRSIKNLGIWMTTDLKFSTHCNNIVNNARKRAAMIRKFFKSGDRHTLVWAFKVYVRPLLEYASQVWSPFLLGDIDRVESVQRAFTKSLRGLRDLSYSGRLRLLGLESLELRRLRADLFLTYTILHGNTNISPTEFFQRCESTVTRGHCYKLAVRGSNLDCRRNFFSVRVVNCWNSLPGAVVGAPSLNAFKRGLRAHDLSGFLKRFK